MTTESSPVVRLAASQTTQAAGVLARAFRNDPMYAHIFPDVDERVRSMPRLWDALIRYSLVYGEVYTTPAMDGVACWLSPGQEKMTLWRMLRTGLRIQRAVMRFSAPARRQFLGMVGYIDQVHERMVKQPHWYLLALGVEPASQGQGIGSRLLQPILARSDREGRPCYLETQTEGNVAFYRRLGFEVVSEEEVQGMRVWAMLREPSQ